MQHFKKEPLTKLRKANRDNMYKSASIRFSLIFILMRFETPSVTQTFSLFSCPLQQSCFVSGIFLLLIMCQQTWLCVPTGPTIVLGCLHGFSMSKLSINCPPKNPIRRPEGWNYCLVCMDQPGGYFQATMWRTIYCICFSADTGMSQVC